MTAKTILFIGIPAGFVCLAAAPPPLLEYLSLNIVGEPPINGRAWTDGMDALGGEWGMKAVAAAGWILMLYGFLFLLRKKPLVYEKRRVGGIEVFTFFTAVIIFSAVNFAIGYAWWDPKGFLGMGPLFRPSMASLAALGLLPELFRRAFRLKPPHLAVSRDAFGRNFLLMLIIAFGYGLLSSLWHCCSFHEPKMYFFFFVTKGVQLWAVTSFFYKWGLKMFLDRIGAPWAQGIIALCFGFTYPWHTPGFAVTFTLFGLALCEIVRRTDSWLTAFMLLYFAYIFHAAIPWHGTAVTLYFILPISTVAVGALVCAYLKPLHLASHS